MPSWLKMQLQKAYDKRDLRRILVLNQCWFYYKNSHLDSD
ncbi:cortex morphogenetic protein CmpA [Salipaludibacillus daqingensis]|nr:cortex morphogenetic protein CmpA [Salipaludibacillus daqingensis]